jgi:hypothetical protein
MPEEPGGHSRQGLSTDTRHMRHARPPPKQDETPPRAIHTILKQQMAWLARGAVVCESAEGGYIVGC